MSLLYAGIIKQLILVEQDERVVSMLDGIINDPSLADRYAEFECTRPNIEKLLRSEQSAFRYLVQSRCSNRAKFSGGLRTVIDCRWCRGLVVTNLRRVYAMRDRITLIHGDGLAVLRVHANDQSVGCFCDPPYTADRNSKGYIYPHHDVNHPQLFSLLAGWHGPWLLTEDNSRMVRGLALCHGFAMKRVVMNTSDNIVKNELAIWRKRRIF